MILTKTKNTINGVISGFINQLVTTLLPFVLRTVMIYVLGMEYAGLNSLFTSILSVLSLADLGFSTAVIYYMYQPIKENNTELICQLLGYYKIIYLWVGSIIGVMGILVMPFLHIFVKTGYPGNLNLYLLYMAFLINTVITYFFGGYRISLLLAHQRNDIYTIIGASINGLGYIIQIAALLIFKKYYLYLILMILLNLALTVAESHKATVMYPEYYPKKGLGKSDRKEIKGKVCDLLYQKIGSTVSVSLDSVIISTYLGVTAVAVYGNYFYVFTAALNMINILYNVLTAGIGNKILVSSLEENYTVFKRLNFVNHFLITFFCTCLLCLYQPFMEIWVGKKYMYTIFIVLLFVVYFFISGSRKMILTYKDALGMWHIDRWKPIIACGVNLVLNIMLVKYIGVAGAIISTIISYVVVEMPWETYVLYKNYFKCSQKNYYKNFFLNGLSTVFVGGITFLINSHIVLHNLYLGLFLKAILTVLISLFLLHIIYNRNEDYHYIKSTLRKHFLKKN